MKRTIPIVLVMAGALLSSNVAFGFHDEERSNLAALAHNLEVRAAHLFQQAQRRADHCSHWEKNALASIGQFQEQAGQFHDNVESGGERRFFRREIHQLLASWEAVEETFHFLHVSPPMYRNFLALERSLHRLNQFAMREVREERRMPYRQNQRGERFFSERVY